MKWFNNGVNNTKAFECPYGYVPGRLKTWKWSSNGWEKRTERNEGCRKALYYGWRLCRRNPEICPFQFWRLAWLLRFGQDAFAVHRQGGQMAVQSEFNLLSHRHSRRGLRMVHMSNWHALAVDFVEGVWFDEACVASDEAERCPRPEHLRPNQGGNKNQISGLRQVRPYDALQYGARTASGEVIFFSLLL